MRVFLEIAQKGLERASSQEVTQVALELWYQNYLPSLAGLSVEDKRVAGYLVDRLSRFNCLVPEQKAKLQEVAASVKAVLPPRVSTVKVDAVAKEWGLDHDLRPFMKDLLPLQTRHFKRDLERKGVAA